MPRPIRDVRLTSAPRIGGADNSSFRAKRSRTTVNQFASTAALDVDEFDSGE
jgi:hypothetical protein